MRLSPFAIMALVISGLFAETSLNAQSEMLSSDPSAFATASAGFTVYQSQLVQSNEPVFTQNLRAGVYGGETRRLGIVMDIENGVYDFPWNGSRITSSVIDIGFRYVWTPFFGGIVLNNAEMGASAPPDSDSNGHLDEGATPQDYMKINARGIGTVIGVNYDINRAATIFSEATIIESLTVNETYLEDSTLTDASNKKSVSLGRRMKMSIGGIVQLTKRNLDFTFGYQKQQLPIKAEGKTFLENQDTIFAGLRVRGTF